VRKIERTVDTGVKSLHTIADRLQTKTRQFQTRGCLFAVTGWVQLLLFGALLWLTVDQRAHEWFHHKHSSANHCCAVQLLAQGKVDAAATPAAAVVVPQGFSLLPLPAPKHDAPASLAFLLPFSCGPPQA
jgi:hypothetical protein